MTNTSETKHILVLASTFPSSDSDPVPAFVKDQIIALKHAYPRLTFSVLAPHDARAKTAPFTRHAQFDEYRFHYMWPRRLEKLAGRGILPTLKANPLYYLLLLNFFLSEFLKTCQLIKKIRPNYLYAHWFTPQGVVATIAGSRYNVPVVITTHASDVAVWRKVPLGGFLVRKCIRNVRAITAVSRPTLKKLRFFFDDSEWNLVAKKTKIIPMGIHLRTPEQDPNPNDHHILFIGRLVEKKGVKYLLEAFSRVVQTHKDARLTIAGDGPLRPELEEQAALLGLVSPQVQFTGFVSGAKKENLIRKSDIFVVPSIITDSGDAEGLPVSLLEGLAAGKICIATFEGNAGEIISNEENGYLVPHKNAVALTDAIKKALTISDRQRKSIESRAFETGIQFGWHRIAEAHYQFLFKN